MPKKKRKPDAIKADLPDSDSPPAAAATGAEDLADIDLTELTMEDLADPGVTTDQKPDRSKIRAAVARYLHRRAPGRGQEPNTEQPPGVDGITPADGIEFISARLLADRRNGIPQIIRATRIDFGDQSARHVAELLGEILPSERSLIATSLKHSCPASEPLWPDPEPAEVSASSPPAPAAASC